jgi:hypothetical protein
MATKTVNTYDTDDKTYAAFTPIVGSFAKAHEQMFESLLAIGIGDRAHAYNYFVRFVAAEHGVAAYRSRKAPHAWVFKTDSAADMRLRYLLNLHFPMPGKKPSTSHKKVEVKVPRALATSMAGLFEDYTIEQVLAACKAAAEAARAAEKAAKAAKAKAK